MIATDTLDALTAEVAVNAAVAHLRGCFPGLHFTGLQRRRRAGARHPVRETTDHLIYLVSGASGHCLSLTHSADAATGVLVASRVADD